MTGKREDHREGEERLAKSTLEHQTRRWPTSPNVFYVLLIVALILVLLLAIR